MCSQRPEAAFPVSELEAYSQLSKEKGSYSATAAKLILSQEHCLQFLREFYTKIKLSQQDARSAFATLRSQLQKRTLQ